jgi:hypothetical protein
MYGNENTDGGLGTGKQILDVENRIAIMKFLNYFPLLSVSTCPLITQHSQYII